jgi:hypothetical protein
MTVKFLCGRWIVNWVRVIIRHRPEPSAPLDCELLCLRFPREFEAIGARVEIDRLQMAKLMEENFVEQESADSECWPLLASARAELLRSLAHAQVLRQSHARRQRTQGNLSPAAIDVAEQPFARTSVIKMDNTKPMPELGREAREHNAHVFLIDVVDAVTARRKHRESQTRFHYCLRR